jgi:hypothetical protein
VSGDLPPAGPDRFQLEINEVALHGIEGHGFAGAGALVADGVISRPTRTRTCSRPPRGPRPGECVPAGRADRRRLQVQVLEPAEQHGGEFLRLQVHRDEHVVAINLARDWRSAAIGLRVVDVAHCMQLLDRLPDAPFANYGLTDDDVRQVRRSL